MVRDGGGGGVESVEQVESGARNRVTEGQQRSGQAEQRSESRKQGQKGVKCSTEPIQSQRGEGEGQGASEVELGQIYAAVASVGGHNFNSARVPVPSGLCVDAWRRHLRGYTDTNLPDFLEFGWPVYCQPTAMLQATFVNHPSARNFKEDIDHYIATERGFGALGGPFDSPPFTYTQLSPLMTRPKKDSVHRRVIMDLSWPPGESINDAIQGKDYVDREMTITLPTVDYMEGRLLQLGRGAYLYKTDLARGYRQLRVDPGEWPLLGFTHQGKYFFDLCPPFGLRTSALCMQRTSEAISWIHGRRGYLSRPYLDDFGGAERTIRRAEKALEELQQIMRELGVNEAKHKVCQPATRMVWLGLWYDSMDMTISIPQDKLSEIMQELKGWENKTRASRQEMQRLLGLLQFVASVSPPARVFTNRMLTNLRETPKKGTESLSLGFKSDLKFFLDLLPEYNGIRIVDKSAIPCQDRLELDACLVGCGAYVGDEYYAERFPEHVISEEHTIAHLELLNIVVALKVWGAKWRGHSVEVKCDNMNACLAVQTGRSRDGFIQHCVRELFVWGVSFDVDLRVVHCPGKNMVRADALSRMFSNDRCRRWVSDDRLLREARRVRVSHRQFRLESKV